MVRTPCKPGLPEHEQNRAGRAELLATSFETFERNIRDQLAALSRRRIRSGARYHGNHRESMAARLRARIQPAVRSRVPEAQQPHVVGRTQFGRITIANSDSGGAAYTDSAINQGHRAVMELLRANLRKQLEVFL
jgi:spermidine dehydrogenase